MAKSNRQYIFEALEILPGVLEPFVEKRLESSLAGHWQVEVAEKLKSHTDLKGKIKWDQASLLRVMNIYWNEAFRPVLGQTERAIVNELIAVRNKFSHNEQFSYDDAERALDSLRRLLESVGAGEPASEVGKMREVILRTRFRELQRNEERRKSQETVTTYAGGVLPWRKVVEPHDDVATGNFLQADFAADLGRVHRGDAQSEYNDPKEFFKRTFLTDGLSTLLIGAIKRLSGKGGDPVVELQTNFGGGKTHSMLALYHMAGETSAQDLIGLDQLLNKENGLTVPKNVNRAVVVGTARGPQDIISVDGLEICTTWGHLAWQLGGEEAFKIFAEHDASGTSPGSNLLEFLFKKCSPCLILIDEWVAYLRQIYKTEGLPSGSFDSNMSFVQSLTEAVKASPCTLLVATLPASQIEVGGEGGQEALNRLKQTFSRIESSWRPASQEESYQIVRGRLFKDIDSDHYHHKDNTIKHFSKLYREHAGEFPTEATEKDYSRKLEKAYPVHPELFNQLYSSWGTLEKFQRTRGVLRFMAQTIYELWMKEDSSAMIMPGSMAVGSDKTGSELRRYLDQSWESIIAGDIDGTEAIPYRVDREYPNLGKYSATRRVARAIFMGTAPIHKQENRGISTKEINLGVIQPGEKPGIFSDALNYLSNQAKFLHSDTGRYWYSLSASLNRLVFDKAEQFENSLIEVELNKRLTEYVNGIRDRGVFCAVQVNPSDSADIPDEGNGVRVVILSTQYSHNGNEGSDAINACQDYLANRGNSPRVYCNTLVFLAAENRQLSNLKKTIRHSLAWQEIVRDKKKFNLTQHDSDLAETKLTEANETVKSQVQAAWCYLIYPKQHSAEENITWESRKFSNNDRVLDQASKRLVKDEELFLQIGPVRLKHELDKYIWKDKSHVFLRDIQEHFARCLYLPRLTDSAVLNQTVSTAIKGLAPGDFAYAKKWDKDKDIYQDLVTHQFYDQIIIDNESLIVKSEVAREYSAKQNPIDNSKPTIATDDSSKDKEHSGKNQNSIDTEKKTNTFHGFSRDIFR